jgi:RNA polymerase sigma-70 factor, ECF subfamily
VKLLRPALSAAGAIDADPDAAPGKPVTAAREAAPPFDEIYRRHFHEVRRWVRYMGGAAEDAEDLAQKVFQVVLDGLPRFDGRNLKGWLYVITRRIVASHRRRTWLRRGLLQAATPAPIFASIDESERGMMRRQEAERILGRMTEKLRTAFILYEIEGYTAEEIAALEDVTAGTIYKRLRLARERFVEEYRRIAREQP